MCEALDLGALATADDAAVAEAVEGWACAEAVGAAGRLAAIAELVERRCGADEDRPADVRQYWSCDLWDATAAEIGAALNVSARRASSQMYLAQSLRHRLPRVNAVFSAGGIAPRLVSTISWRTHLVTDTAAMAAIDAAIAEAATNWGVLSDAKVEQLLDTLVDEHDPKAREWFEAAARGMDIEFGKPDDVTGTRSVWGRLYSTHAELIERKLTAMARAVCPSDPRTVGQRRAEAMGVVFAGGERIACQCGSPECPNRASDALAGSVVIHVVVDPSAVTAAVAETGESGPAAAAESMPRRAALGRPAAVMCTGGVVPTPLLAQLIRNGAAVVPLRTPCDAVENRYRPSVGLQRFVRCRDLTCRFPGCDAPAEVCDIDHAIAHPVGPTHPSNLRCLCRKHHLLKTFYVGTDGWSDRQLSDGTIIWTAPTGRTYTTYPGSRAVFPEWNVTTTELPSPPSDPVAASHRGLQMPLRGRTRAADRVRRVKNRRARQDSS